MCEIRRPHLSNIKKWSFPPASFDHKFHDVVSWYTGKFTIFFNIEMWLSPLSLTATNETLYLKYKIEDILCVEISNNEVVNAFKT
jgi:hypothetical protein